MGFEALLLNPAFYTYLLLGVSVGMVVGIIPGLGGSAGMAMLVPFVVGMDPVQGVALLIGMLAITTTSDSFASILLGVPGTAGSQATVIDGYRMTRDGQGATALGAAFSSSLLGGVFGAGALMGLVFVARPLILALGSPELLMLSFLGISVVALVSRGSVMVGLMSASLGLFLGSVGAAPAATVRRFTFDSFYLYSGFSIVVISLGLFAIPELVHLLATGQSISKSGKMSGSRMEGVRATLRNKRLVAQSSLLGVGVGIIPGLGGSVVDWLAYALGQRTVRDARFGEGDIRGVIAPESANNAKEGGALVPTLLFAIPGSASMAIFIGGLMLMGVHAGPRLVEENYGLVLAIVLTLALANVIATTLCFSAAGVLARISELKPTTFAPFLIVVFSVAAYQNARTLTDLLALFGFGLLGTIMMYLRWSRVPLIIGFVLAVPIERYLTLSYTRYGGEFLQRPLVLVILTVNVLLIFGPYLLKALRLLGTRTAATTTVERP